MSKSKPKKYFIEEEADDYADYIKERKNRRKQKRMRAALKTKDISTLVEFDEDEYR